MIEIEQARALRRNDVIFTTKTEDKKLVIVKLTVTSVKTWKLIPNKVKINCRRGFYQCTEVTEDDLHRFYLYNPLLSQPTFVYTKTHIRKLTPMVR